MTTAAISASWALEATVFSSRPISWTTKSSFRPTAPDRLEDIPQVDEVGLEADQLLRDVEPLGHQRHLLRQPRRVDAAGLPRPGAPARRWAKFLGQRRGRASAGWPPARRGASARATEIGGQRRSLARPHRGELLERGGHRRTQQPPRATRPRAPSRGWPPEGADGPQRHRLGDLQLLPQLFEHADRAPAPAPRRCPRTRPPTRRGSARSPRPARPPPGPRARSPLSQKASDSPLRILRSRPR